MVGQALSTYKAVSRGLQESGATNDEGSLEAPDAPLEQDVAEMLSELKPEPNPPAGEAGQRD